MSTLHIVSSSPFQTRALQSALKVALKGDAILLIENGVYAAVEETEMAQMLAGAADGLRLYALVEDLNARALSSLGKHVIKASYTDFVQLVCQHHNSVSWS
jgi:tRNA 2-thiouridine synthesizing protein B